MRHHGTDPRHFLWHTHQFPDLERMLVREPQLRATLRRLPGPQVRILQRAGALRARGAEGCLAIADLFDGVFSIEQHALPPQARQLRFPAAVPRRTTCRPARCIMVEDTLENLRTAKKLGMKTVWVTRERPGAAATST